MESYKRGWGCSATCGCGRPWRAPQVLGVRFPPWLGLHRVSRDGANETRAIGTAQGGPKAAQDRGNGAAVCMGPHDGAGATALRFATCCDEARHHRRDSEFFVVPGSTGSLATGTTNWGRVGRHRPAQRRAQERCTNVAWRRGGRALWVPTETWCLYHYTGHGQFFWGCQRKVPNATRRSTGGMRTRTRGSQPHLRR